jgi:hypothetical protein
MALLLFQSDQCSYRLIMVEPGNFVSTLFLQGLFANQFCRLYLITKLIFCMATPSSDYSLTPSLHGLDQKLQKLLR